jgi:hypothetical protein
MEISSENETNRFLSALWYRWGETLVREIGQHFNLTDAQRKSLQEIICRPNDWVLNIKPPINSSAADSNS